MTFEVIVVTRADLWKPVAYDALGVVVCLGLTVTTPVLS